MASNKFVHYFRNYSFNDFLRKGIFYFIQRRSSNLFRKIKAYYFFKNSTVILGKDIRIHGLPVEINIGKRVNIYDHCVFEFGNKSRLIVGSDSVFSYGVVVSCRQEIIIGNDVQIGEYSSLRDSTHQYIIKDKAMKYGDDIIAPISIADNVWIGRGCLVMPGTVIEEGVVVAANSVVKGHLQKDSIYGGCPARFIRQR